MTPLCLHAQYHEQLFIYCLVALLVPFYILNINFDVIRN